MPKWNQGPTAVFRGSNLIDPTAVGFEEIEIGVDDIHVIFEPFGDSRVDIAYDVQGQKLLRPIINIRTKPFYKRNEQGVSWQTHGEYQILTRVLYQFEHLWLFLVWESGLDQTPGNYFKMADESGTDTFFNLTTDIPAGIMPWKIEPLTKSESKLEAGTFELNLNLQSFDKL